MAKPRKNYTGNKIAWHWILFYVLVGFIIFSLLYYSGVIKNLINSSPQESREIEYYQ